MREMANRSTSLFLAMLFMASISLTPNLQAYPSGIGSLGNNGCVCHGASSDSAVVSLGGLPDAWAGNTTYTLYINSSGPSEGSADEAKGGFRLLVDEGTMSGNESLIQIMDEGMTHTEAGNKYRTWVVEWTSPQDDTLTAHFKVHSNAVNGDGSTTGDSWTSHEVSIAGENATGIDTSVSASLNLEVVGFAVIVAALIGLLYLLVVKGEDNQ